MQDTAAKFLEIFIGFETENLFIAFIIVRTYNSLLYLVANRVTHSLRLPYVFANILRLLGSIFDLVVLLSLLFNYIFEWCEYAYSRTIVDMGALIFISGLHWAILIRHKERVQPVFILSVMAMLFFLIVTTSIYVYGGYKIPLPALFLYFGAYNFCCLIFHFYEKQISAFMENASEKLSWVDPLLGSIPHTELALRNTCSFSLGLVNLMYVYTSTASTNGVLNIIPLSLIGLSLTINALIGLRLIKTSASVKLETSFMLQIVKQGYSNITTIYAQLKNKQLPKATWYAWVITLIMGVTLTAPAYASHEASASTDGQSTTGINNTFSVSGSGSQPSGSGEGEPVPEGAGVSRAREGAQRLYQHTANRLKEKAMDAPADAAAALITTGLSVVGTAAYEAAMGDEQPTANQSTELAAANDRADQANERADQANARADQANARAERAERALASFQKSWVYRMCPACFRATSSSTDASDD